MAVSMAAELFFSTYFESALVELETMIYHARLAVWDQQMFCQPASTWLWDVNV